MQWAAAASWQQCAEKPWICYISDEQSPALYLWLLRKVIFARDTGVFSFLVYHPQILVTGKENVLTIQLNSRPTLDEPDSSSTIQSKKKKEKKKG